MFALCRRPIISETMSELQAALEFQVELGRFYNIDLFQRGSVLSYTLPVIYTYPDHIQYVMHVHVLDLHDCNQY